MAKNFHSDAPTIEQLIAYNESKYIKEFCVFNFQRKYRKFFKFNVVDNELFFMRSKISKHSLRVTLSADGYASVISTKKTCSFEFFCLNDKEFIEKLVKHDLV